MLIWCQIRENVVARPRQRPCQQHCGHGLMGHRYFLVCIKNRMRFVPWHRASSILRQPAHMNESTLVEAQWARTLLTPSSGARCRYSQMDTAIGHCVRVIRRSIRTATDRCSSLAFGCIWLSDKVSSLIERTIFRLTLWWKLIIQWNNC